MKPVNIFEDESRQAAADFATKLHVKLVDLDKKIAVLRTYAQLKFDMKDNRALQAVAGDLIDLEAEVRCVTQMLDLVKD